MKKLGIVGGIGPESTLDYYKGINDGFAKRVCGGGNPPLIIDSLYLADMYAFASNKQWPEFTERLVGSVRNLAAGGADLLTHPLGVETAALGQVVGKRHGRRRLGVHRDLRCRYRCLTGRTTRGRC